MPGLYLRTANRLEPLAHTLAMRTRIRSEDPFAPAIVVIQSRGMERWLALQIARHTGIAANLAFPFPETFLRTMLEAVLPEAPEEPAFQREAMAFAIFARLARIADGAPEFAPIRSYLAGDASGVRRLQLAEQVAHLFDQYLVFRPDMILAWDEGRLDDRDPHQCWQALLWRDLTQGLAGHHRARLWQRMLESLEGRTSPPAGLPRRVSIFGISYLPPFYLQALAALSQVMSVDLYQLNPCREYWADIVSRGEEKRRRRLLPAAAGPPAAEDLHWEQGNRLLASMGAQGRAFHRLIGNFDPLTDEDFQDNDGHDLLAAVQDDILNLRNHPAAEDRRPSPGSPDPSIQIHACHSPMREIEVLNDHLLDRLNADSDLAPRDILVLTPDIDTYAPYIQSVFGAPEDEAQRLPFSIADRSPLQSRPVVEAFFQLLELKDARFPVSEVAALLDLPAVRSKFELDQDDVRLIGQWISETRIRWGLDAGARSRLGLPATDENTWQAGLDRLLLGYALPAEMEALFSGILPARGVEGSDAEALGHLVRLIDRLKDWQARTRQVRPMEAWSRLLPQLLDDFFSPGLPEENDLHLLRRQIGAMHTHSSAAGLREPVGIEVVRAYLKRRLADERSGAGFIAGGITFGALLPMRSIPAKVICLVGMNQDGFPREDRPAGFDLMAANPRLGDRSRRDDDKYLFLEALISARRCFYVSYVGYDIQDNTVLPPSVLVSELLDYVSEAYDRAGEDLVVHHRLQSFAPDYFTEHNPRLFSYSRQSRQSAAMLARARARGAEPEAFIGSALPDWDPAFHTVDLETLARALSHPCRFLLESRLQLRLHEYDRDDQDRESFQLAPLDRYTLGQDLIEALLSGTSDRSALQKARAAGRLPHGDPGQMSFEEVYAQAEEMAAAIRTFHAGGEADALTVQLRLPPYTLTGLLAPIFPSGLLHCRFSYLRGPDILAAWLRHLVWCRMAADDRSCVTTIVSRDGIRCIKGVERTDTLLDDLLALYHRAGHQPVAFFPRSSWDYAVMRFEKGYSVERALARIRAGWVRTFGWPGESEDPYIQYCFPAGDPLGDAFATLSEAVYGPIMQYSAKL